VSTAGDIRTLILSDPAVSGLVGNRVYPQIAPEGATYPLVVYSQILRVDPTGLSTPLSLSTVSYEFTAWAESYITAHDVEVALVNLLNKYRGTTQSTTIHDVELISSNDNVVPRADGSQESYYGVVTAFRFTISI